MGAIKQADPYNLQVAARIFTHHAGELKDRANQVERLRGQILDGKSGWRGQGASAFSARCEILKYELNQSAEVLELAVAALQQLSTAMEQVNQMRSQANHLEAMAQECSPEDVERRMTLLNQAGFLRSEADWHADSSDRQAASAFAAASDKVPTIIPVRETEQDFQSLLMSLPEPYRSYYERHPDLLAEEEGLDASSGGKKRHIILVGGIDPDENVNELAINNMGEMLVDEGEADSYQVVDEFTPNNIIDGVGEVTQEKLFVNRHRSDDLAKMIEEYHKAHPDEEIDIIAHSGGGEIAKNAENELYFAGEGDDVNKIISFGGADWSDPENKKIYHITSPYDIVGVPGNLAQEELKGMNNPVTEFLGERSGKQENVVLDDGKIGNLNVLKHINPDGGDHVNYFEPGTNLNNSYQNVVQELNSKDSLSKTSPLPLLGQNNLATSVSERLYYSPEAREDVHAVENKAEQVGETVVQVGKKAEQVGESIGSAAVNLGKKSVEEADEVKNKVANWASNLVDGL